MASFFFEWTKNLAFYMVLVTMVVQMIPNNSYKKYVRFFIGLILIVMLTEPVFRILDMKDTFMDVYNSIEVDRKRKEIEDATRYLEEITPEQLWDDE